LRDQQTFCALMAGARAALQQSSVKKNMTHARLKCDEMHTAITLHRRGTQTTLEREDSV
jgi:hypothetical protein